MQRTEWIKRKFTPVEDSGLLPFILERLAGTAARVDEITFQLNADILTAQPSGKWSVKQHIGHLSDLEPLWLKRADELADGSAELSPADMTNKKTNEADHNNTDIKMLSAQFREQREQLVSRIRSFSDAQLSNSALHPRLQVMMRVADLAYFVAEHDDHHLAAIRAIGNEQYGRF